MNICLYHLSKYIFSIPTLHLKRMTIGLSKQQIFLIFYLNTSRIHKIDMIYLPLHVHTRMDAREI